MTWYILFYKQSILCIYISKHANTEEDKKIRGWDLTGIIYIDTENIKINVEENNNE